MTESCVGSITSLENVISIIGTVSSHVPNIDAFFESVPEMGYDALSAVPRGEVCIRGKTFFDGYYKQVTLQMRLWLTVGFTQVTLGSGRKMEH